MGVYSVMRPDTDILRETAGLKSVVILGCSSCANTCIAHDKGFPVSRIISENEHSKTVPVAVVEEANLLKVLFENNGIKTRVEVFSAPCVISDEIAHDQSDLIKRCNDAEGIVTLFCPSGIMGIRTLLRKELKIVPGMKTKGLWQRFTFTDREKGLIYIDKDKTAIIRLVN